MDRTQQTHKNFVLDPILLLSVVEILLQGVLIIILSL